MCDLTTVNPTDHSFPIGTGLNQAVQIEDNLGVYDAIGNGTLTNYVSSELTASGTYSTFGVSGDWSLSIVASGSQWNISVNFTGDAAPYARSFTASCSQPTNDPPTLSFQDINSGDNVQLIQFYSEFSYSKIEISPSWSDGHAIYMVMN